MKERLRRRWWVIGLVVAVTSVLACGMLWPDDDDRVLIDKLVQQAKEAIEQRAPGQFIECFADNYKDESGLSREDFYQLAARVAREVPKTEVVIHKSDIRLAGEKATGTFDVDVVMYDSARRIPWHMNLEVQFAKKLAWPSVWKRTWVVQSMKGHSLDRSFLEM